MLAVTLPPVETIPDDIDEQLRRLIHQAPEQVSEEWLYELIKNSGHLTTPDHMRWRVVSLVWLATQFSVERAWPYLMWLNMNEPVLSDHFNDLLTGGVEELQCHVQVASWIAQVEDERLQTFFSAYKNIPAPYKLGGLARRLIGQAQTPEVGLWLGQFCRDTADNSSPAMRPWRLLIAAWYATCFNPGAGLTYLRQLSNGADTLPAEDNQRLADIAAGIEATSTLIHWIANCPDLAVKRMLQDFGRPDLEAVVETIFQNPPDYEHLAGQIEQAAGAVQAFAWLRRTLEAAHVSPQTAELLDLGCGPLAAQTLLLNSAGYHIVGADIDIPPAFLPTGLWRRFKKRRYVKAWQIASQPYYQTLAQHVAGLKLTWKKTQAVLADPRRLDFANNRFDVVICMNHLQHAPDVNGLLAEAARVLKPDGLFLIQIKPYSQAAAGSNIFLNQWSEAQYQAAVERYFTVEQWQADDSPEESPGRQVLAAARKE